MIIKVNWNDEIYEAAIVDNYMVRILDPEDKYLFIELSQCKECGVWKSEDEELYGDGYCTKCAEMCIDCELYYNRKKMFVAEPPNDGYVCKEYNKEI